MKRVGPLRVKVFEAGAGKVPKGVVNQALRAKEKRMGRTFFASDFNFRKEETLRWFGLKMLPSNLRMVEECSLKELKMLPAESMDIVFESFFVNKLVWSDPAKGADFSKAMEYFAQAKKVLKPRGRMILIQPIGSIDVISAMAKDSGFRVFVKVLSGKQALNSPAEYIAKRATQKGREELFSQDLVNNPTSYSSALSTAKKYGLRELSDIHLPVAIILRK